MCLRMLGTTCQQGTCPAVYATDRNSYVVQGKIVTDPDALGDVVNLADDETLVEIPKNLARFFSKG